MQIDDFDSRFAYTSALLIVALCSAWSAGAEELQDFNIPPQRLESALLEFSEQSGAQIGISGHSIVGLKTKGVSGRMMPRFALAQLIDGSNLEIRSSGEHSFSLAPATEPGRTDAGAQASSQRSGSTLGEASSQGAAPSEASDSNRQDQSSSASESNTTSSARFERLETVVVTAQKRVERLQDVPVPVTAISGETLIDSNRLGLQEYSTAIPGLSVTPRIQSGLNLSIRGITTGGFSNPTVGVTVDDVPYGASTALGGGLVVPDMDPGDLARVEVLRGPQGTLYGASSMGGLLKFVTIDPSFERFSGRVQAGVHSVHNGDGLGYNARGSVNLPLSDTSALRASAFRRVDPGYIDNPVLAIDGINEQRVGGGQLSVFWQPSDAFSMKLGALIQETKGDGLPDVTVQPGLDDLQQSYVRGAGAYDRETQALSATLTWELGDVDLTSVSGYNINSFSDSWDFSDVLGGFFEATFAVAGAPVYNDNKARKLTQEIRLSAPLGERAEWLLGAFYTDEDSDYEQNILAVDPVTGRVAGQALNISFPSSFKEYAIFGNVTIDVTEQFDVQFGARQSEIEQSHSQFQSGPLIGPAPVVDPKLSAETDALTFLVTPRFKISPDVMLYARVASGYRAGGPNLSPGGVVPSQYEPDKTKNYDIGLKGSFIGDSLSIDASLYHIDWEDIQLFAVNPQTQYGYNFNGSQARSQGAELSIESRPLEGLAIAAWVVWSDAELTQDLPSRSAFGLSGDSLPNSSRFSGSFSLEQEFTLVNELRASVGGSVSYIGDRKGVFTASPQRQKFPSYTKIDLRAGIKHGSWTLNVFANNVADKRGVISGGLGQFPPFAFQYIQPRTIGLSLAKNF